MRKVWIVILIIILTGGIVLCAIRWNAWFGNPPEPIWTGDTIQYVFPTFGEDSVPGFEFTGLDWADTKQPDTLEMLVFGDVHNSLHRAQWLQVAQRHPNADCYMQIGDFVERGYEYYNQMLYHEITGTPLDSLPIINVPGNHEYRKGVIRTLPDYWTKTFKHPHNGPINFEGTTYYVDLEDARVIAINTNGLQYLHDFTRVNTWLKRAINGAEGRFIIVIMHHPVFSSGMGRQNINVMLTFARALEKADLVCAGHDHTCARHLPYVNLNSAEKFYLHKLSSRFTRVGAGMQLYGDVRIYGDTLHLQTRYIDNGELYDDVLIIRTENGKEIIDNAAHLPETIDVPDRYAHKKNWKTKQFAKRRIKRLHPVPKESAIE